MTPIPRTSRVLTHIRTISFTLCRLVRLLVCLQVIVFVSWTHRQQHKLCYCCAYSLRDRVLETHKNDTSNLPATKTMSQIDVAVQVMARVQEKVRAFMSVPDQVLGHVMRLQNLGIFPQGLITPEYRSEIMKFMYSEVPTILYFAFETGTYQYYWNDFTYVNYREPGNDGYLLVKNDTTQKLQPVDDEYEKHYTSCVNSTTGEPRNCIMEPEWSYVDCINDCELIPCPDDASQMNCAEIVDDTKRNECMMDKKWCPNYEVKTVQEGEGEVRGYVPYTTFCIDQYGQPEERPGYVLKNYQTGELGDCYYYDLDHDIKTSILVNRTLEGEYAYCGDNDTTCDTTFKGGFFTSIYDPRTDYFYIDSKKAQKPVWTEPYNFVGMNKMGITYSHPIYYNTAIALDDFGNATNTTSKVFQGVAAVDYFIYQITDFLIESYSYTDIMVFIVEQKPPHYVIAASAADTQVQKLVLVSDGTTPCPPSREKDNDCIPIRVPVKDLKLSGNHSDIVMDRAFLVHENLNTWGTSHRMNFKESDEVGAKAYSSRCELYQQDDSDTLTWIIFVIFPMERQNSDTAMPGEPTFLAICMCGCLGLLGCLSLLAVFFRHRSELNHADWKFTCAFIGGCAALNLSTFTLIGENTNGTCMLRMWSFNGLFVSALSPLFVKVWRMAKIINASVGFRHVKVNNVQAMLYSLPLVVVELIILMIFSIIDPPRQTERLGVGEGIGLQTVTCEHDTSAFFITQIIFDGCLIFIGCILAFTTRNLHPKFGEARQLGFSMYNIAFTGIVIVTISIFVELDSESKMILQAVGVLWASFFCSLSFVLPRLLEVKHNRRDKGSFRPTVSGNLVLEVDPAETPSGGSTTQVSFRN